MSVRLSIDFGRASEAGLRTIKCSGSTISYRPVKTGKPGRLGFDVFFWASTSDPEELRFLGIWQGATPSAAVESFRRSHGCKVGADELSRKGYNRFVRRHRTLRSAGRATKRGLKSAGRSARRGAKKASGYVYHKL